jgi:predicted nucleic acid-binding protein
MTVLVDSDILIEVSRARDTEVVAPWIALSRQDDVGLYSPISAAELWAGARPAEHETLKGLFDALTCVGADAATGRQAGDYLRHYGKSHAVELGDALIAAAAVLNHAALWTGNWKHYPMKDVAFF